MKQPLFLRRVSVLLVASAIFANAQATAGEPPSVAHSLAQRLGGFSIQPNEHARR